MQGEPGSTTTVPAQLDYELLRLIGRGSYGEVWLARDKAGAYRAVKVIFRESFDHERPYEREYEGICKFEPVSRSYDNQVQILHVGRHDAQGRFYYIMELADDQRTGQEIHPRAYVPKTLKSELKKRRRFPVKEAVRIGMALSGALENLHQHGLIHRDIKPANIIFVQGVPKLADIGLVTDRDVSVSYVGTEGYIPPAGPSSAQADIFSLGKVLYEMATGRDRMDFPELPTDLEELPDREALLELNAVVAKACARDPRKRYRSAQRMFEALAHIQRGDSVRNGKRWRQRLVLAGKVGTAAALTALLAVGAYSFWKESAARKQTGDDNRQRFENKGISTAGHQAEAAPVPATAGAPTAPSRQTNSIGMKLVWIPPGTFTMGSPKTEKDYNPPEGLQTVVTLTDGFFIGTHEVTQGEYEAVIGSNPSAHRGDPNLPVETVSWIDATNYCARLTERERQAGRLPAGYAYRLPTEAEWEYAARAGTTTRFSHGDDPDLSRLGDYAWYNLNSGGRTHPVGMKLPNAWGLYDMAGNVWEWCEDSYNGPYPGGSVTNRRGGPVGVQPICRGGSAMKGASCCRSAPRWDYKPTIKDGNIGFRVVLGPAP